MPTESAAYAETTRAVTWPVGVTWRAAGTGTVLRATVIERGRIDTLERGTWL